MSVVPTDRVHRAISALLDLDSSERLRWLEQQFPDDPVLRSRLLEAVGDLPGGGAASLQFAVDEGSGSPEIEKIGRYEVIRRLGAGGMGEVYLARDPAIRRQVAIKVLQRGIDSPGLRQRFVREARAVGQLRHPNIVTLFDVQEEDDRLFLAMEYIPGRTLSEVIEQRQPLSLERRLDILEGICSGLEHAHRLGVLHRDIKPANLILDNAGGIRILDFGIAKALDPSVAVTQLTSQRMVMGTVGYISPEHLAGGESTALSDMFATAVVGYELLTYARPFGTRADEVSRRALLGEITPMSVTAACVPEALELVLLKAMAPRPANRYRDMGALRRHLVEARAGLVDEPAPEIAKASGRRAAVIGAFGVLAVAATLGWLVFGRDDPQVVTSAGGAPLTSAVNESSSSPVEPLQPKIVASPAPAAGDPPSERRQVTAPRDSSPVTLPNTPARPQPGQNVAPVPPQREDPPIVPPDDDPAANAMTVASPEASAQAVREVLQQYQQAYLRKSAAALKSVYPALTPGQLAALDRTFLENESYLVELGSPQITLRDDRALVTVAVRETITPTSGSSRVVTGNMVISLERSAGIWTISAIQRR